MATNDFLPFATATGANVTVQATYAALSARGSGFQSGVAQSDQVNKVLRQAAFIAAAVAQFVSTNAAVDTLDDGNLATFTANLLAAIRTVSQTGGPFVQQGTGIAQLNNTVKLGWSAESKLKATIDVTNVGNIALETWVAAQLALYRPAANDFSTIIPFNSSSTFTVPPNVTRVRVRCWGAGGSGGGSTNMAFPGGGGGAGGYGEGAYTVAPGTVIPVTVGVGTAATAGGTTSFGTFLTASGGGLGGSGGTGAVGAGGLGGAVAGQQFGITGGTGSYGIVYGNTNAVEGGTGAAALGSSPVRAVATSGAAFSANAGIRPGGGSSGCTFSTAPGGAGLVVLEF